jgi:hypothetical protein
MPGQVFGDSLCVKLASSLSNATGEPLSLSEHSFWKGDGRFHTESITLRMFFVKWIVCFSVRAAQLRVSKGYPFKPKEREAADDLTP